jgi:restriction system protein
MPPHDVKDYLEPILMVLSARPEGLASSALAELAADLAGTLTAERTEARPDGTPKFLFRLKQARYILRRKGFVTRGPDKLWALTTEGKELVDALRARWQVPTAEDPTHFKELRETVYTALEEQAEPSIERVDRALRKITEDVEEELTLRLGEGTPEFLERTALKLLETMGYGRAEHTGGRGDEGIDGVLRADRLGLERVCMQAKRRRQDLKVTPDEIRSFIGALAKRNAMKGVLVTTSGFTKEGEEAAREAPRPLELIDGKKLVSLMIEYGVGVSREHVRVIPEVDLTFFEDD